jgi:hypothetical protein
MTGVVTLLTVGEGEAVSTSVGVPLGAASGNWVAVAVPGGGVTLAESGVAVPVADISKVAVGPMGVAVIVGQRGVSVGSTVATEVGVAGEGQVGDGAIVAVVVATGVGSLVGRIVRVGVMGMRDCPPTHSAQVLLGSSVNLLPIALSVSLLTKSSPSANAICTCLSAGEDPLAEVAKLDPTMAKQASRASTTNGCLLAIILPFPTRRLLSYVASSQ